MCAVADRGGGFIGLRARLALLTSEANSLNRSRDTMAALEALVAAGVLPPRKLTPGTGYVARPAGPQLRVSSHATKLAMFAGCA